jgi:hypothetical protein
MTSQADARTLAEDVLARASEDWVTAAEVIDITRRSGLESAEDLRDLALGLIARLVVEGLVVPGDYDGFHHSAWDCTPAVAIARIAEEWSSRSDPFVMPGEIVWLDTTPLGQQIGETVLARESG